MGNVDLDGISLFAGLTAQDRDRVAAVARRLHWDVGDVALSEGEFAFDFYAITSGAVEVQHDGQSVATLGAGDFFGEIGLTQGDASHPRRRRSATVVVTAPTEAVSIAASDMRLLSDEIPGLKNALERAAAERSRS